MPDHIERAALLIAHPKMTRPAKLHPDCPVCHDAIVTVQRLADAGLLADPEQALDLENAKGTLAAVRWKLGTPEGRAVSMHAGEIAAELKQLRAKAEELTDFAGEQANARRESDRVRNLAAREAADLRDERDSARTALAEKTEYAGEKAREGDVMSLQIEDLTAELKQLQGRIDAAFADLKEADELSAEWPPSLKDWTAFNSKLIHARAALQGDQPEVPGG